MTREEQETIFRTSAADDDWEFYSRDPKFKRLLERRGYSVIEDKYGLWSCKIPLRALSVRRQAKPRIQREPTERQKEARLKWANLRRSTNVDKEKKSLEQKDEV